MEEILSIGELAVLFVLGAASCASLAVFIERFSLLRGIRIDGEAAVAEIGAGRGAAVAEALGPAGTVVRAGLDNLRLGKAGVREKIDSARAFLRSNLESRVALLGTIGANAPFLGLLGTVLGIIRAFRDLAAAIAGGSAQPGAVMAGISTALWATAAGLAVAIPAVIFNNLCRRKIAAIERQVDGIAHAIVAMAPDSAAGGER